MKRLIKRLLILFLLLGLGAGCWAGWTVWHFLTTPPANPGETLLFDIEPGARLSNVAARLEAKGIITNARYFTWLARYRNMDARLQAGRFALHTGTPPDTVLDTLVNGRPVLFRITLREGLTWWETAELLEQAGFVKKEDFRDVIFDKEFLRHHGIPFASAEGFLMPETYFLKKEDQPDKAAARAIADRLVYTFREKLARLFPEGALPRGDALKTLVILASIVEKETAIPAERPRIAGVYTNRLAAGMLLQADPTVIYGLGASFKGTLRRTHLNDAENPYNTYKLPGLPPGPICSPGMGALKAAAQPEAHKFFYFVAVTDGGEHSFSSTLDEHNKAVRRYWNQRRKKAE